MRPITKIDIITRTEKLDELKVAFAEIGVTGMTVSQVFGCEARCLAAVCRRGIRKCTAGRLTILTLCRRLK